MSLLLTGTGVSQGLAIGRVRTLEGEPLEVTRRPVAACALDKEVRRFRQALAAAQTQLVNIRRRIPARWTSEIASFVDAHLLMLKDRSLSDAVVAIIRNEKVNAEWALKLQRDKLAEAFDNIDDPYLASRSEDIDQVINRIQRVLLAGPAPAAGRHDDSEQPPILVADDLSPADIIVLQDHGVPAAITESGGASSHTSIIARSLGFSLIVGVRNARHLLREQELVAVDTERGFVLAAADEFLLKQVTKRKRELAHRRSRLQDLRGRITKTRDGLRVYLRGNIESPEDLPQLRRAGAEGIGLYRTEFLYLNRDSVPGEDEQVATYRKVLRGARGAPVIIRTLDFGADKVTGAETQRDPPGRNPALGLRAIRLCMREPELFRPQLRALLRVAAYGPMSIMLPMISSLPEVGQVLEMLEQCKSELRQQRYRFSESVPIGVMIEVPSAALVAHRIARMVDFLSIGTNDLIQYTLAIDRVDESVNHLYDPVNPAVLRLIRMTLEAGRRAGIPVSMCGEMAGNPAYTRLLLGLGLKDFSMHPASLLEVKQSVVQTDTRAVRPLVRRILASHGGVATQHLLARLNSLPMRGG